MEEGEGSGVRGIGMSVIDRRVGGSNTDKEKQGGMERQ